MKIMVVLLRDKHEEAFKAKSYLLRIVPILAHDTEQVLVK